MVLYLKCSVQWWAVPPSVMWVMTVAALEISHQKTEESEPGVSPAAQRPPAPDKCQACAPQGGAWAVSFWSAQTSASHKEDGLSQKLH